MQHTRARSVRAIILSLAIALGGASPALAVETSATTAEDLTVLATITMTGVPASISYGGANVGDSPQSALQAVTINTSNPNGARLEVSASNLTGAGTIPSTARSFTNVSSDNAGTIGGGAYPGPAGVRFVLFNRTAVFPSPIVVNFRSVIAIPSSATPGAYTGSLTFFAVTN